MRGFTLIEILIVIGISAILVAISAGVYTTLDIRSNIDIEARELESVLNLARDRALASDGGQSFGVHIDISNNQYFLFPGNIYVESNPENEKFEISPQVSVLFAQFQGGGNDIVFARLSGSTQQYGSVTLQDVEDALRLKALCINEAGSIEIRASCETTSLEYSNGTSDGDLAFFPGWSGDPAQSFTTGTDSIYARKAELYLKRSSLDPFAIFNLYLEIREASTVGGVIGKSWITTSASLPSDFEWISFVFSDPVLLAGNTQYFLRLRSLPDSTFYDPFNPGYSAQGLVYWGYEHSAFAPPAYAGGDAWRYIGRNDAPSDQGQRLGPDDQYDFSFRILYGIDPPPSRDSRHLEFDLEDSVGRGWSIQGANILRLKFHDPPNADVIQNIPMADYFNNDSTEFDWEGTIYVRGNAETLRAHSNYIDANDTILSVHRDRDVNQKAVDISIGTKDILSYASDGTPTVGAWGGVMIYR